jgi:hypothetical protein
MSAIGNGAPAPDIGFRTCPTRVSPVLPVIAHRITAPTCQQRQRDFYHKCWTCLLAGRLVTRNGLAPLVAAANGHHADGKGSANGNGSASR